MARKKPGLKVPVGERTLIARINRKLRDDDDPAAAEVLKKSRGDRAREQVGNYYVVTQSGGYMVHPDVDLEEFARKLGVLKPYEELAD